MHLIPHLLLDKSLRPDGEQISLRVERRQFLKRRWRGIAVDGTEFGFDLEAKLTEGCVIWQTPDADYVVRQTPEAVYEVQFGTVAEAAMVAWKVGNLHLPAQILGDCIRVIHDEAMGLLLQREGWTFSEPVVIFTPMRAMAHAP